MYIVVEVTKPEQTSKLDGQTLANRCKKWNKKMESLVCMYFQCTQK